MSTNSWHGFQPGDRVSPDHIVSICEQRVRDGFTKPSSADWLRQCLGRIGASKHDLVWTPLSWTAWGATPLNPNNWRTLEGHPLPDAAA